MTDIAYVPQTLVETKRRLAQVSTELTAIGDGLRRTYERQGINNAWAEIQLDAMANMASDIATKMDMGP